MARQMRVFLRAWIVWEISKSPFLLGFVTSSLAWPMLFMPFVGGFLADKVDRKKLLKYTEVSLTILWAIVASLVYFEIIEWWHFVVSSVMSGIIQSIGRPGHQAILGSIVTKKQLPNAVALDNIAETWPRVAGPALGGLLIAIIGTGWLFILTSIGQLFTAITIFLLKWDPEEQKLKQDSKKTKYPFFEGFKHVWREKVLLGLIAIGFAFAMVGSAAMFLLPIFADAILGVGASGLGYIMTASTIGTSIGALIVVMLTEFKYRGYLLFFVAMANTIVILAFSRSEIFMLSLILVFFMGMSQMMFRSMRMIAMQILTPNELRGRVLSFETTVQGTTWIGTLIMGSIAEYLTHNKIYIGTITLGGNAMNGAADAVLIGGILYGAISIIFFGIFGSMRRFR